MSDRPARWRWVLVGLLLAAGVGWALDHRARTRAEERAETATAAADSLRRVADSLEGAYRVDTLTLTRWRTRWDSIVGPGRTDTLTVEKVTLVADSTIRACTAALSTCEQRVAVEHERGDSLATAAANWQRVARGPLLRLAVEGTLTTAGAPQGAGEVTVGRGHLRALGRVELGAGTPTCGYAPGTEVLACPTPVETTVRLGVRWVF